MKIAPLKAKRLRYAGPNFSDPRVARRVFTVIKWAEIMLHADHPKDVHSKVIDEIFGHRSKPLTAYLRDLVLVKTGDYIVGKKSQGWKLNRAGLDALKQAVGAVQPAELVPNITAIGDSESGAFSAFEQQIETGDFEYREGASSARLGHTLQRMPSVNKQAFWTARGYCYNYDIECAGVTILTQLAIKHGLRADMIGGITGYLANRHEFREHLATTAGISAAVAKEVINALVMGAGLAANGYCAIFTSPKLLNRDRKALAALQADARLAHFRGNLRRVWQRIEQGTGQSMKSAKSKARLYFSLERTVLDSISDFLAQEGVRHFKEHDGVVCDQEVEVSTLRAHVLHSTGFSINLALGWKAREEKSKVVGVVSNVGNKSEQLTDLRVSPWVSEEHHRCLPSGDPVDSWSAVRRTPG